jgi:hypothetical protein
MKRGKIDSYPYEDAFAPPTQTRSTRKPPGNNRSSAVAIEDWPPQGWGARLNKWIKDIWLKLNRSEH